MRGAGNQAQGVWSGRGTAEVIVCPWVWGREGTAIVLRLICRHKEAAQPAMRPFPRANGYGAEAVQRGAGCGTPVLPLHATHPNPPDACCLPCLCLLRPPPASQLNSRPPGPLAPPHPRQMRAKAPEQMATFGSRVVPACGTLLGCDDHPSRKPPPHPARCGRWGTHPNCSQHMPGGVAGIPRVGTLPMPWGCQGGRRAWKDWQPRKAGVCP